MKEMSEKKTEKRLSLCWMMAFFVSSFFFLACSSIEPAPEATPYENPTLIAETVTQKAFATPAQLEALTQVFENEKYKVGPGDILGIKVWKRPEVSDPQIVVGPDGFFTAPRVGFIKGVGRTREDITHEITEKLHQYYSHPEVTLSIEAYQNNKAFVLGRVENPGVVTFPGKGTLLEALSMAGGYSTEAEETFLTKCAIIRGKDTIIWIDLDDLLQGGNMALNARIKNNDVIFIPESQSELVYVMGEVYRPGALPLTGKLSLLDALMKSGGPTRDAKDSKIFLIRYAANGKGYVNEIDMRALIETGDFSKNYLLKDNDVLYVARTGISKFNYVLRQIMPSLQVLNLTTDIMESFGVMQEVRNSLWGQEGTVGK